MDDNEFMQIREDSLDYSRNKHENALKRYLNEAGFKDTFAYEYNYSENKFTIYTSKPGYWIGKFGAGVKFLKEILSKDVRENCSVEFKEIRGGFVTCK